VADETHEDNTIQTWYPEDLDEVCPWGWEWSCAEHHTFVAKGVETVLKARIEYDHDRQTHKGLIGDWIRAFDDDVVKVAEQLYVYVRETLGMNPSRKG